MNRSKSSTLTPFFSNLLLKVKARATAVFHTSGFCSFFLAVLTFFLYQSYSQVFFGKYFPFEGDGIDIALTTLKEFYSALLRHESLYFSWSNCLGMNTSAIYAYQAQLFGITSPLYLIFHTGDYSALTAIAILIKIGLASLFFTLLAEQALDTPKFWAVVFGIFYSNCSFFQYNTTAAFIWSDSFFMLPLLILLLYRFCKNGTWKLLPFAYAYLFLTNFYMGYIVGFFTLLLLITYLACQTDFRFTGFLKKMSIFGCLVILGILMSAFVLLPAFLFIMSNSSPDATTELSLSAHFQDLLNQLFVGANSTQMPYVYCGLPALLLFPSFCTNRKISVRSKLTLLIPLVFMTASCFFSPLYLFWHCGDSPDGFYYRFSFLISFLLCLIGSYQVKYLRQDFRLKSTIFFSVGCLLFYLFMLLTQSGLSGVPVNRFTYFAVNVFFFTGTIFLLRSYVHYMNDPRYHKAILLAILLLTSAECIVNGYALYYNAEDTEPSLLTDTFYVWDKSMDTILADWSEDSDFFRVADPNSLDYNSDSYFGYHGTSDFGTFEKYQVRNALRMIGLYTSPRLILSYGFSDFSNTLLAVKYKLYSTPYNGYVLSSDQTEASYLETGNYNGLGFLVDRSTADFTFSSMNAFKNINELACAMTGTYLELYEPIPQDAIRYQENGITIDNDRNKLVLTEDEGTLTCSVAGDERPAYMQFITYEYSYHDSLAPILEGGYENQYETFGTTYESYLKSMLSDSEGQYYINIRMDASTYQEADRPAICAAYYNEEEYEKFYDIVSQNEKLEISEYKNGYILGTLTVPDDSYILYTSIPYDEGWTITANGEEVTPIALLDGAFIGLDLPVGEYELEFTYTAPGATAGIWCSAIGFILYLASVFIYRKRL